MMFREEVVEMVGPNQVSGWWIYQHDDWKRIEIGDYTDYSPYRSRLFAEARRSDQHRKLAVCIPRGSISLFIPNGARIPGRLFCRRLPLRNPDLQVST